MEYYDYLKILEKDIHSVVLAINDEHGHPATAFMDVMLTDKNGIYFMTSRGKDIYARMNNNKYAALSGMVGSDFFNSKMISVRGKIRNIGNARVTELFEANPYMYKIYPSENGREVIDVFQIYEGEGEYIDFSTTPPVRTSFSFGGKDVSKHGYFITDKCTSCGTCASKCPMKCIEASNPYKIHEENCLHCGNCYYSCPVKAVKKYN